MNEEREMVEASGEWVLSFNMAVPKGLTEEELEDYIHSYIGQDDIEDWQSGGIMNLEYECDYAEETEEEDE